MPTDNQTAQAALYYLDEGFRPIPIPRGKKGPIFKNWTQWKMDRETAYQDFPEGSNLGILLGAGLVCVDLDCAEALELAPQFLPNTGCVIGRPGRPNCHWFYWVGATDLGNKSWRAKVLGPEGTQAKTLIDLLSEGKQVVVGPSVHPSGDLYDPLAGTPANVEAGYLLEAIETLSEAVLAQMQADGVALALEPTARPIATKRGEFAGEAGERPGDGYNREHPGELLARHGWTLAATRGSGEHWRRPGKTEGISASLSPINGVWVFYNFSSSSPNLEPGKAYDPLGLLAALEHGGDIGEAARALRLEGFGAPANGLCADPLPGLNSGRGKTGLVVAETKAPPQKPLAPKPKGPEPFPEDCLRVPGFLELVFDYNLRTTSRKQPELALGSALALLSVITGNRVKSFCNHTTYSNLYILGLAPTGAGKDHGRKVNQAILDAAGYGELQGATRLGSHAGLIAALEANPTLLLPVDEIGDLLQRIKGAGAKAPYLATIPDLLKILKHAVGRNYKDAVLSGGVTEISSPHLVIFGTTTPDGFWESITHGQARDGLLSRFLVFESRGYVPVTEALDQAPPEEVVRLVRWWRKEFSPGNLPTHIAAEVEADARQRFLDHERQIGEKQIQEGEADPMRAALWSRAAENTNQLALLAACSRVAGEPGEIPIITISDMNWAIRVSNWQTRRMTYKAETQISENEWDGIIKRCQSKLFDGMSLREFRRKNQTLTPMQLKNAVDHLIGTGAIDRIEEQTPPNGGPKSKVFRLGEIG